MDVAPSQMIGLPLIDWCGAGFCAGAAVEAVDGPVGAAAAIPAGAVVAPATLLLEEWAGAAPVAVGRKAGALTERRGAGCGYVRPWRMVKWPRLQAPHFAGACGQFLAT